MLSTHICGSKITYQLVCWWCNTTCSIRSIHDQIFWHAATMLHISHHSHSITRCMSWRCWWLRVGRRTHCVSSTGAISRSRRWWPFSFPIILRHHTSNTHQFIGYKYKASENIPITSSCEHLWSAGNLQQETLWKSRKRIE